MNNDSDSGYIDDDGNCLTVSELRRLLRRNSSPQYKWWHAKPQPKVDPDSNSGGRPPPGVRDDMTKMKRKEA